MTFKNVSVICEGQTEVDFVKKLNKRYFNIREISLKPIAMNGNVSIDRIAGFINKAPEVIVTTFIDYYGIKGIYNKNYIELEKEIKKSSSNKEHTIISYVQLHEIEALWFSNIEVIATIKDANDKQKQALQEIVQQYPNPENINNNVETAPSKRLKTIFSDYKKINDGNIIANNISIEEIKDKCPHFSWWLNEIEIEVNKLRK